MDTFDRELDGRLASLAERAPAGAAPSITGRSHRRRGRVGVSLTLAVALALGAVATATAGAVVVSQFVRGTPGVENDGQPLHGANLECMTPPEASAYLAAHGFTSVVWQVESGGNSKLSNTSVQQATAPAHGFVIPGSIIDGRLYMVVDQRVGATGVGACNGMPMP
jgi:hypothetical protein